MIWQAARSEALISKRVAAMCPCTVFILTTPTSQEVLIVQFYHRSSMRAKECHNH